MTENTTTCGCGEIPARNVAFQIFAGDINITHIHCGKPVALDDDRLMSEPMPMTLTYAIDEDADEAYLVLSLATGESAVAAVSETGAGA